MQIVHMGKAMVKAVKAAPPPPQVGYYATISNGSAAYVQTSALLSQHAHRMVLCGRRVVYRTHHAAYAELVRNVTCN
jgi:hypothetical protein